MLKVIAGNAQHIGARQEQQDSFAFSNMGDKTLTAHGGLLGVVADGMGGLEGGQLASRAAVDAFLAVYKRKGQAEPIPAALYRSLDEANRAVLAVAERIGANGNTGTTLAAAVVHKDQLYWIAAGDSRIYLLRDGQLARVNQDHTYATSLWPAVAEGTLERASALTDPQAAHLTSHLGMEQLAIVDIAQRPFPLQPDDVVIVCSDGIYRAVGEDEVIAAFRSSLPAAACEAIKGAVLAKGRSSQDNLTILAIQCRQEAAAAPRPEKKPNRLWSPLLAAAMVLELLAAAGLGALYVRKQERAAAALHETTGADAQHESQHESQHGAQSGASGAPAKAKASPAGGAGGVKPGSTLHPGAGSTVTPGAGSGTPGPQQSPNQTSPAGAAAAKTLAGPKTTAVVPAAGAHGPSSPPGAKAAAPPQASKPGTPAQTRSNPAPQAAKPSQGDEQ